MLKQVDESLYTFCLERLDGPVEQAQALYEQLQDDHVGRAYHNWDHVRHCLELARLLIKEDGLAETQWAYVAFSLFNHDRVLDNHRTDNEELSAQRAMEDLGRLDPEVQRLILVTKKHEPLDALEAVVSDADLSILASPEEQYERYAQGIREEYSWVSEKGYIAGRAQFLTDMLTRALEGRLFAHVQLDHQKAKENLTRELELLTRLR